jgi:metallo-beta-lactamase family protein
VLHHLKQFAPDPKNVIVLAGYQAAGTRGRSLQDGAKEIKIHGAYVPVNAQVQLIENLSAHADADEIMEWLARSKARPRKVFVTHGEPIAAQTLAARLTKDFGWPTETPELGSEHSLE